MTSITQLSVVELRHGLLKRDFSAKEVTQSHLSRINDTNPTLNSFLTVAEDTAIAQAEAADALLASQGGNTPLLTGIPIAIKDMLVTNGLRTTCASRILENFVPPYDGTAVANIKSSGGIILGKTNLDEFAMGSSNENSAFGAVRNPWDTERVPGGSSGGSAAAVASGQAPLALGTDTGGSIRQPASFTGIYGLKPTYGRVSRYGAVAFASSLDQIGPFARSIDDLAILLEVIAGHDIKDSTSLDAPVPSYYNELQEDEFCQISGVRIGVPIEYWQGGLEKEVEDAIKSTVALLEKRGAKMVDISLPNTDHALAAYYIIAPAEASSNLARYDGVRYGYRHPDARSLSEMYELTRGQGFGAEIKRRIMIGNYVLSAGYYDAYYLKAQKVRTMIIDDFRNAFANQCEIILAPVAPTTAFKIGEKASSPLQMYLADIYTIPASLAGLPGLTVPCGVDSKNLPIGLQLIGKPLDELSLLKLGKFLERELSFDVTRFTN